jgi:hypothetical protein
MIKDAVEGNRRVAAIFLGRALRDEAGNDQRRFLIALIP